jgi:hypothetical protein
MLQWITVHLDAFLVVALLVTSWPYCCSQRQKRKFGRKYPSPHAKIDNALASATTAEADSMALSTKGRGKGPLDSMDPGHPASNRRRPVETGGRSIVVSNNSRLLNINPKPNEGKLNILNELRRNFESSMSSVSRSNCGIMWTLSSLNGSNTDYGIMRRYAFGESFHRLGSVFYEAIISAGRVRRALAMNSQLPSVCKNGVELALFIDRDMVANFDDDKHTLQSDLRCAFDRVLYFDDYVKYPEELMRLIVLFTIKY